MERGVILSSRLFISDAFTCIGADSALLEWLSVYANGIAPSFLALVAGTPFQREVMLAMQKIPFGQTAGYRDLACICGYPGAARAIGNACKRNPFPLFVPCHRVIQSDGKIGGFACDVEIKKRLLEFEAGQNAHLPQ